MTVFVMCIISLEMLGSGSRQGDVSGAHIASCSLHVHLPSGSQASPGGQGPEQAPQERSRSGSGVLGRTSCGLCRGGSMAEREIVLEVLVGTSTCWSGDGLPPVGATACPSLLPTLSM